MMICGRDLKKKKKAKFIMCKITLLHVNKALLGLCNGAGWKRSHEKPKEVQEAQGSRSLEKNDPVC